jgi:hypothetical protein
VKRPGKAGGNWLLAVAIALPVFALVLLLFRQPPGKPAAPAPKPAVVGLAPLKEGAEGGLLREEATFGDPTPLFLPTPWNASENAIPEDLRREPSRAFPDFEPKLRYADSGLGLQFPADVRVPEVPADAFLSDKPNRPFLGFGETDRQVPPLPLRGAFIEVARAGGEGDRLLAQPLADARPPGDGTWQPMEFLVAIDPTGIVRPPVLTESSRVAEVDAYFENYLRIGYHLGARLRPGFYRVSIGP